MPPKPLALALALALARYFAGPPEVVARADRSRITAGRYSSIATGVRFIVDAEHDRLRVTTSPRHGVDVPGTTGTSPSIATGGSGRTPPSCPG